MAVWLWKNLFKFLYLRLKSKLSNVGVYIEVSRAPVILESMHGAKFDESYLRKIVNVIKQITLVTPVNLVEVGANLGQDSAFLGYIWGIDDKNVVAIEPIPQYAEKIKEKYGIKVLELAISDEEGRAWLNLEENPDLNLGNASLHQHPTNHKLKIEVQTQRLDAVLDQLHFRNVDFLKIDTEGHTWQVLRSLGERIKDVGIIQIETEYVPVWNSSINQEKIFEFLEKSQFVLVDYVIGEDGIQADSLWIRNDLIIRKFWDRTIGDFRPHQA
jgi:FkbM family methyltransferase